ncbi:MAG: YqaA family protein [Lysobacterales bacterium]|jgi:membrane protein YqaA with SNARE-associated domain
MFQRLYDRVLSWSAHRHAPAYLSALSFTESSFFPIPPDVMLIPMCLARHKQSWYYATLCTASSVLGGMAGYLIGRLAFGWIEPWLMQSAYAGAFTSAVKAFETWGFWYILLAGFTPIPYKVFTISAGVVGMPLPAFIAGSAVGRGGRFFLVAALIRLGGERFANRLRRYIDWIGWGVIAIALVIVAVLQVNGS